LITQVDWGEISSTRRYAALDHLGSTRFLLPVYDDGSVGTGELLEYYPFGRFKERDEDLHSTHLFTGHERDLGNSLSGLDYMHARYYSPNLGRFLSVDPIGGSVGSSQSWNRYSYVRNNPLLLFDPDGLAERVSVQPLRMSTTLSVAPTIRSQNWSSTDVNTQLSTARDVYWDQASVMISWDTPEVVPGPESMSMHEAAQMSDMAAARATNGGSGEIPVLFVGEIEGRVAGISTSPSPLGGMGAAVVGDPGNAVPLATAHELGHALGLDDSYIGWDPISVLEPNLMNDENLSPVLTTTQVDDVRKNIGSE
jgi:RHS repeat-associated protein